MVEGKKYGKNYDGRGIPRYEGSFKASIPRLLGLLTVGWLMGHI